jgi:pyridoxamine 5'-phosphate oxidase-like protein
MTHQQELRAIARTIIDSNQYMTLGTADEAGRPWVSPVWYAAVEYREFFWVSRPLRRCIRATSRRARR